MQNSDLSIFRGSVDGKQKYCRILIRRKRASVEQALEFFGQSIQDLDEIAAEAGEEDKAEIRAMQACCVTAMDALRAQQERENPKPLTLGKQMEVGLKSKYIVRKADTGEGVDGCFVLRPDKDLAAVAALRAYAAATDNDVLAADIIDWVGAEPNVPLTLDELRQMDGEPVFLVDLVHKSDPEVPDLWGGWIVFTKHDQNGFIPRGGGFFSNDGYGKTWLAYRQKPKEGKV